MSARDEIETIEATLESLRVLAAAEDVAAAAKAAYQADTADPAKKAEHRTASAALIAAREAWGEAAGKTGVHIEGDVTTGEAKKR